MSLNRTVGASLGLIAIVSLLAACGGSSGRSASVDGRSPGRVIADAAAALRAVRTFAFEAQFTRQKKSQPKPETYMAAEGALDLASHRGRMSVDLSRILGPPPAPGANAPFDKPWELSWDAKTLTLRVGDRSTQGPRARLRRDPKLLGHLPDEPAALVYLLAEGSQARLVGPERVRGEATTRYAFVVDARRAGRMGVPAELAEAFKKASYGPTLPLEIWIGNDDLPRRIAYSVALRPIRRVDTGGVLVPARVVRVIYELSDFGKPVKS